MGNCGRREEDLGLESTDFARGGDDACEPSGFAQTPFFRSFVMSAPYPGTRPCLTIFASRCLYEFLNEDSCDDMTQTFGRSHCSCDFQSSRLHNTPLLLVPMVVEMDIVGCDMFEME